MRQCHTQKIWIFKKWYVKEIRNIMTGIQVVLHRAGGDQNEWHISSPEHKRVDQSYWHIGGPIHRMAKKSPYSYLTYYVDL
jgi:hypothetical protein